MRMNVRETNVRNEVTCFNEIPVIWGSSYDTLGFYFNNKALYYFKPTKAAWGKRDTKKRSGYYAQIRRHNSITPDDKIYLLQDSWNEKYTVRIIFYEDEAATTITIVNIDYGLPNYILAFNCAACLDSEK